MPLPLSMVPFSSVHGWVVVATALAAAGVVSVRPLAERYPVASRRLAALALLGVWLFTQAWHNRPGSWRLDRSLPLHICDVVGLIAVVAIATRKPWARSVLHHCSFSLCVLAYLAPAIREGPNDVRFWTYWVSHAAILLAAIGDMTLSDFRPDRSTLRQGLAALGLYVWIVFPANALLNTNYGYIGPVASQSRAMLQRLGEWPLRVASMELIVVVVMAMLTVLLRRRSSVMEQVDSGELLIEALPMRMLPTPRPMAA